MKNILWSTWEPALNDPNSLTSGGGGSWTRFLFNGFLARGFNTLFTQAEDPNWKAAFTEQTNHDFAMAVFCWRWKFPDEPHFASRNAAFERQTMLIDLCKVRGIPFIVHDQDLKMSPGDRAFIYHSGGKIFTPSLFPAEGEDSLHFPNPYAMMKPSFWSANQLTYVGNNYERMEQFTRLLQGFSLKVRTHVFGNWLEPSKSRMSPEKLKEAFPHIVFGDRLRQGAVVPLLFNSRATLMLHKPEYGPRGFMTLRYAEAAAAGTVPFIPYEFALPFFYKGAFEEIRVRDSLELLEKYIALTSRRRVELAEMFAQFVSKYQSPQPWFNIVERLTS